MAPTEYASRLAADDESPPLLVYGHGSDSLANLLSTASTVHCVAVHSLQELRELLSARPCIGLTAMSRQEASGEAGLAIGLLREAYGDTEVAVYGAWDYNVARAAKRAIEYGADGILMPGIETNDLLQCMMTYLARVQQFAQRPATTEEHEALLRALTPRSPFWKVQDRVASPYF